MSYSIEQINKLMHLCNMKVHKPQAMIYCLPEVLGCRGSQHKFSALWSCCMDDEVADALIGAAK